LSIQVEARCSSPGQHQFQVSNISVGFQLSALQFSVFSFQFSVFSFQLSAFKFQISAFGFRLSSFRFKFQVQVSDSSFRFKFQIQVSDFGFQISSFNVQVSNPACCHPETRKNRVVRSAAQRRKNKAHGVSRGVRAETSQPRRGARKQLRGPQDAPSTRSLRR
jgi:hypothetical protein